MSFGWGRKYKSVKVDFHGRSFHSKLEAAVYSLLLLREKSGEITDIKCQVHVKFHTHDFGKIHMIPDFSVVDSKTGELFYVEAKGLFTRDFARKRKAWLAGGPGRMEVWVGRWQRPMLKEILVPKSPTTQG